MQVYLISYIILPLGLLLFIFSPRRLYELLVFSVPFTGTAIMRISVGGFAIEGLGVTLYLGVLCLLRYLISAFAKGKVVIPKEKRLLLLVLVVIAAVVGVSLIMPIIIDGDLYVLDTYTDLMFYAEPVQLHFKLQYVTQVTYFIFGCLLACYFALKNDTDEKLQRTVKVYLNASIFVCAWGLFELVTFYLSIPYPSFLFNTNYNSMNHDAPMILNGFIRVVSVSLEPSVLSQQLTTTLPLFFWPAFYGLKGDARNYKLYLVLVSIVLLASQSTTSAFALISFFVIVFFISIKRRTTKWYLLLILGVGVTAVLVSSPFLLARFVEKLGSFSGIERLKALEFGWKYFLAYPVFGIGWGVFPSWDFIVCVLAGVGIIGMIPFAILLRGIHIQYRKQRASGNNTVLRTSVVYSFVMLLLISQFSGFTYYLTYFWLILGLTIAAISIRANPSKLPTNEQ